MVACGIWLGLSSESLFLLARRTVVTRTRRGFEIQITGAKAGCGRHWRFGPIGVKINSMVKKRQTRREQVQEAEKIYEWLIFQRELVGDLIRTSVKTVHDRNEAANARLDLQIIAKTLSGAAKPGSRNAVWQDYQHHFVGNRKRERFFAELHSLTRRIASARLVSVGEPREESATDSDESFDWNKSLLPRRIAPHVLRIAILHPGVIENFLTRFFVQASDLFAQKSTYRRALLILQAVPMVGWSDAKHAKNLILLGAVDRLEDGSEVETVKKFIRDLRRRHRKYFERQGSRPAWPTGDISREKSDAPRPYLKRRS